MIRPVHDLEVRRLCVPGFGFVQRSSLYGIPPWMWPWPLCAAWGGPRLWRKRTSDTPSVPVRPVAWPLLCYTWGGRVYINLRLPFGAHSSPFIFTHFGGASLDCRTRSRVPPRPPLPRCILSGAGLPCCVRPRPASFPGPLPRPWCPPPSAGEAGPANMLPLVPGHHPGLLSSGEASRLPARVADAAEMHQAGAAVADRNAFLRVQGGPSGPHFPPAAYRFIYGSPGLGAPHQPYTDNMPVVQVWTTGTCKCPAFLFPCPAERKFASGARAGLPEY